MGRINQSDEFNNHDRRNEHSVDLHPALPIRRDDVMQMLGAAKYAEWLQAQSGAHVIQFLITVEEEKLYLDAGHDTFAAFLDHCGLKSKSAFYRHREIFLKEGPERYDLFTNWKIPLKTRRLLDAGEVTVDGGEIVIGDDRYPLGDSVIVKTAIEQLVREKMHAVETAAGALVKAEKLADRLEKAGVEKERLEDEIASFTEKTPYEAALGGLFTAFKQLAAVIECMDPDDREDRAEPDLQEFTRQMFRLREAYGVADWQMTMKDVQAKEARA